MSILAFPKNLVPSKAIAGALETQFTAAETTVIGTATVTNTSVAAINFSYYLPNSGAGVSANQIGRPRSIAPNETYIVQALGGQVLEAGQSLVTEASALGLTLRVSGVEYTVTA